MNREDFERIDKLLYKAIDPANDYSNDEIFIIYKFKEIEVLEDIAKSLKYLCPQEKTDWVAPHLKSVIREQKVKIHYLNQLLKDNNITVPEVFK